jgi:hypothetical protein
MLRIRLPIAGWSILLLTSMSFAAERSSPAAAVSPSRVDTSPPLAQLASAARTQQFVEPHDINPHGSPALPHAPGPESEGMEAARSAVTPLAPAPAPFLEFDGIPNINGVAPPDTQGDVGKDHYVQWVNLAIQIFDKSTGATVLGPIPGKSLWAGFGGPCETNNNGDPIVLYDHLADRWFFSQFAISDDGHQCIAISQTGDPTGSYHRYDYVVTPGGLNDYPKFAVWPDGYYYSANQFTPSFSSALLGVFERQKMLVGDPSALFVHFEIPLNILGPISFTVEPANLEGTTPPRQGSPGLFVQPADRETWLGPADRYDIWRLHVDYANVSSSTLTLVELTAGVPAFSSQVCFLFSRNCIPQPGTTDRLDSVSQFTMYRPVYRNFGGHEVLLVNHTVSVGLGIAGIRWAEIRNPFATPTLFQTGTHSPDGHYNWMGSLAMDGDGNILLGYSKASGLMFPSIAYAGRKASDPLGTLPRTESLLINGSGSQLGTSRWGDYSTMSVDEFGDPSLDVPPDCAFWYTNEYVQTTGSFNWRTHVGAMRFPDCGMAPPSVSLSVNGVQPWFKIVTTPGPLLVSLDMDPGTETDPLDWYFGGYVLGGEVLWVTPTGISTNRAPLRTDPPLALSDYTLIDTNLPPGTIVTLFFFLQDGADVVASDWIVVIAWP